MTQLCFYAYAYCMRYLYNLAYLGDIFLKGKGRTTHHHVGKARAYGPHGLRVGSAMILAHGHRHLRADSQIFHNSSKIMDIRVYFI